MKPRAKSQSKKQGNRYLKEQDAMYLDLWLKGKLDKIPKDWLRKNVGNDE